MLGSVVIGDGDTAPTRGPLAIGRRDRTIVPFGRRARGPVMATVGAGVMVVGIDASRREVCWVTLTVARGQPLAALAGWPRAILMPR